MPELDKAKDALIDLGWSEYESRTYSALVQLGSATASKIAKNSAVPPNRVYQILGKLAEKGVVHKNDSRGTTTEYSAAEPSQVLGKEKDNFIKKVDRAITALDELKERIQDEEIPTTYTIYGKREVATYLQKAIKEAEKSVFIAVDTLVELDYRELVEPINSICKTIKVDILTTPRGINDPYEIKIIDELEPEVGLKISEDNFSTIFMIVDDKIMIYSAYGFKEEDGSDLDYYGVYTEDYKTSSLIKRSFEYTYNENAKYVREEDQKKAEEEKKNSGKEKEVDGDKKNKGKKDGKSSGPSLSPKGPKGPSLD